MRNLRIAMILYGAIQISEGFLMWLVPNNIPSYIGFDEPFLSADASSIIYYILAIAGAAFITGGCLFIMGSFNNPWRNPTPVRLAVLWSALMLFGQIYAVTRGYVGFGHVWFNVIITIIFLIAFLVFYPWPFNRKSL
jgi:peptidoglycan/LPS O-acetylase OafA/YrhL